MGKYTQKEVESMFHTFLDESGFYDDDGWMYGYGELKKDILIWAKGTPHQDILDWFDNHLENGLNEYMKTQWDFWCWEDDICSVCPKLIDCSKCTFENPYKEGN